MSLSIVIFREDPCEEFADAGLWFGFLPIVVHFFKSLPSPFHI